MMKRKHTKNLFIFAAIAFCLMCSGIRTEAASTLGKENYLSRGDKTIRCDITGDGKQDTVKFRVTPLDAYFTDKGTVYINGKKALTVDIHGCNSLNFRYVSCSKKKSYLQIGANADGGYMRLNKLYKYSKGKLTEAADLGEADNMWADITGVSSSYIKVTFSVQPWQVGRVSWSFLYKPSGNKLKLKSSTAKVTSELGKGTDWIKDGYFKYFKKNQFVTSSGRKYYTSSSLKKKAFSTKPGDIVTIKKIKISGKKMYLCFKKGKKTGWVRIKGSYSPTAWFYGVTNRLAG